MKLTTDRPYSDPEKAARRLMQHAHAFETVQDSRIYIEKINGPFLFGDKGTPAEYAASLDRAIAFVYREGKRVRLFTRNGHDWTDHYPLIAEVALRIRIASFVLDGEAVLQGVDGRSDFDGLHRRQHNEEVQFYAFDVLMSDGDGDCR